MLENFRTYKLAVEFHKSCSSVRLPGYLKNQLLRASSSIALNLAEGSAKPTQKDKLKFYFIALGSLRECQAVLDLNPKSNSELVTCADQLGACLYRLTLQIKHLV
jgi:four helix bundle protein